MGGVPASLYEKLKLNYSTLVTPESVKRSQGYLNITGDNDPTGNNSFKKIKVEDYDDMDFTGNFVT